MDSGPWTVSLSDDVDVADWKEALITGILASVKSVRDNTLCLGIIRNTTGSNNSNINIPESKNPEVRIWNRAFMKDTDATLQILILEFVMTEEDQMKVYDLALRSCCLLVLTNQTQVRLVKSSHSKTNP